MTEEETTRTPPQDVAAEQAVLGAMMLTAAARDEALNILDARDFYRPAHETLFEVIADMAAVPEAVDAVTVHGELRSRGLVKAGYLDAPLLHSLVAAVPTTANVGYHAVIVKDLAIRRQVIATGTKIVQAGYSPGAGDGQEVADWAAAQTAMLRDRRYYDDADDADTLPALLESTIEYDWLVPGLLERGDRLLLTGEEGAGKTMLSRQVAVCVAAGVHPFTHQPIEPRCVMVVDLENGRALSQRRYRSLSIAAAQTGRPVPAQGFFIHIRPQGLDVTRPSDARWLLKRVEAVMPDLLVIGPAYRLAGGDPNEEQTAREVVRVLDQCRATSGCAVLVETHSPHASGVSSKRPIRPIGSSLWRRWPEFGYGLRIREDEADAWNKRLVDLVAWRGPRDEREWPERLRGGGTWPWVEDTPSSTWSPHGTTTATGTTGPGGSW